MLARTHSAGVVGIDGYVITVESDIGPGLPGLTIVGQSDGPLHAAGMRALAALDVCGFALARCRQVVNLAPAEQRKDGTGVDLALACALLVSHGVVPAASLAGVMLWGELAPDGSLRSPVGTLIAADTARRDGFRALVLPQASVCEAALIPGLHLLVVADLRQLIAHLRGEATLACVSVPDHAPPIEIADASRDRLDPLAQLALEVMVAGGHHLLVHGSGTTKLARQVAGLLDELGDEDALELTKIHSTRGSTGLVRIPEVRVPSPTESIDDLLGEVSLAHRGVLLLDELTAFSRDALGAVCDAMREGVVSVAGKRFPSRFRLLATTTRCPSGAMRGVLAPLLDQVDLVVPITGCPGAMDLRPRGEARRRIALAQRRQLERLAGSLWQTNAEIPASGPVLEQLLPLTEGARHLLASAGRNLSPREVLRMCRVARTVADLDSTRDPSAPIDVDVVQIAGQLRG